MTNTTEEVRRCLAAFEQAHRAAEAAYVDYLADKNPQSEARKRSAANERDRLMERLHTLRLLLRAELVQREEAISASLPF